MSFDGGWGYILSAIIGSAVMWIFNRWDRHSDRTSEDNEQAHAKVDALEKKFLEYRTYVAENYVRFVDHRDFEKAVFQKLDDIVKLINTKADKA